MWFINNKDLNEKSRIVIKWIGQTHVNQYIYYGKKSLKALKRLVTNYAQENINCEIYIYLFTNEKNQDVYLNVQNGLINIL